MLIAGFAGAWFCQCGTVHLLCSQLVTDKCPFPEELLRTEEVAPPEELEQHEDCWGDGMLFGNMECVCSVLSAPRIPGGICQGLFPFLTFKGSEKGCEYLHSNVCPHSCALSLSPSLPQGSRNERARSVGYSLLQPPVEGGL